MKHRQVAFFPLTLLVVSVVSLILVNSVGMIYAAAPAQTPTPTIDAALKAQADKLRRDAMPLYRRGEFRGALDKLTQALSLSRRAGDRVGEGKTLNNIGVIYQSLGQYTKALEFYQLALVIEREVGDRMSEGATIIGIGMVYQSLGQYPKALEFYQQALAIAREVGDRANEGTALNNIGFVYNSLGQYSKALDFFQQALAIMREVGDYGYEGATLNNIGEVHYELGQYGKALEFYLQALAIVREVGDQAREGAVLHNIGGVYWSLGQYAGALDFFQQSLAIMREIGDRGGEGTALNSIGIVYKSLGQYAEALEFYQQALALARELGAEALKGRSFINIGEVYGELSQYAKALEFYQQALAIVRQVGDRSAEGTTLHNVGIVYDHLGQYPKALRFFQEALVIEREVGDRAGEGRTLHNIGLVYVRLGQYAKALEFYRQALAIQREVGDRAGEGRTLHNIGVVYGRLDQYSVALDFFQQALAIAREVGDRAGEAATPNNIGFVYDSLGQYAKALEYYQQALAIAREVGNRAGEGTALANSGFVYERNGELQQALDFYQQSIAVQENIRSTASLEEFKTSLAAQSVDVYWRATLLLIRLGQSSQAFNLAERARARTFLDQLGNTRLDIRKGADAQLVQQEQALRLELAALERSLRQERAKPHVEQNAEVLQSLSTQLASKQKEYEDLLIRLKLANPEYASLISVTPLTLSEVQNLLDKDTTLLSYFVTPDKTLAFVVTQKSFEVVELPVSEKDLNATIIEFRRFASLSDPSPPSLKQLYAWLIAPLKAHLKTPAVGIIPHSVLHYLPFAALSDGQRYLGDDYTLFYLPSASALPFIQQKRKGGGGSLLAMAQSQAEGLPILHYSDQEAQAIANLYNTQALVGNAATESAFRARAGDYNILHLAAHGQLNTINPLFSRIILAPDKDADGSLEVHEVYGLDLAKADLVVLSACQTQLGAQSRGDDIIGLNRAFIYAGTPTVIASLWSVDDQATGILMTSFYTHLRQGKGKAEALQSAQAEVRAKYPHPYYWAAFVLTGDAGTTTLPVTVSQSTPTVSIPTAQPTPAQSPSTAIWLVGAAAVVILLGLTFWIKRR